MTDRAGQLYLDRLKRTLARAPEDDGPVTVGPDAYGETMIGLTGLDNIDLAVRTVLEEGVPGDLMETGVWRGGASIFMRAALFVHGDKERCVWVADSFAGLPEVDMAAFPEDEVWSPLSGWLAVSQADVEANFRHYGFLDDRVRFLPGWFRDTLPNAPVEQLAVLRLDGDFYESTFVALEALYGKVSPGGFVIIDDYGGVPQCKQAVDDFRADHAIDAPVHPADGSIIYWRKPA